MHLFDSLQNAVPVDVMPFLCTAKKLLALRRCQYCRQSRQSAPVEEAQQYREIFWQARFGSDFETRLQLGEWQGRTEQHESIGPLALLANPSHELLGLSAFR